MSFSHKTIWLAFVADDRLRETKMSTKLGEWAFSFAVPHVWNQLPQQLRAISNPAAFRKYLKTHTF